MGFPQFCSLEATLQGSSAERLEEDLRWVMCHVSLKTQWIRGLNWSDATEHNRGRNSEVSALHRWSGDSKDMVKGRFSVLPSQHFCRLMSACLTSVCMASTKIVVHVKRSHIYLFDQKWLHGQWHGKKQITHNSRIIKMMTVATNGRRITPWWRPGCMTQMMLHHFLSRSHQIGTLFLQLSKMT